MELVVAGRVVMVVWVAAEMVVSMEAARVVVEGPRVRVEVARVWVVVVRGRGEVETA